MILSYNSQFIQIFSFSIQLFSNVQFFIWKDFKFFIIIFFCDVVDQGSVFIDISVCGSEGVKLRVYQCRFF